MPYQGPYSSDTTSYERSGFNSQHASADSAYGMHDDRWTQYTEGSITTDTGVSLTMDTGASLTSIGVVA